MMFWNCFPKLTLYLNWSYQLRFIIICFREFLKPHYVELMPSLLEYLTRLCWYTGQDNLALHPMFSAHFDLLLISNILKLNSQILGNFSMCMFAVIVDMAHNHNFLELLLTHQTFTIWHSFYWQYFILEQSSFYFKVNTLVPLHYCVFGIFFI